MTALRGRPVTENIRHEAQNQSRVKNQSFPSQGRKGRQRNSLNFDFEFEDAARRSIDEPVRLTAPRRGVRSRLFPHVGRASAISPLLACPAHSEYSEIIEMGEQIAEIQIQIVVYSHILSRYEGVGVGGGGDFFIPVDNEPPLFHDPPNSIRNKVKTIYGSCLAMKKNKKPNQSNYVHVTHQRKIFRSSHPAASSI